VGFSSVFETQKELPRLYVTDSSALRDLVAQLRRGSLVGIDTEFMRERTYFARLCLIQLGNDDISAIVDPLACDDLSPLCDLFTDTSVVKVLHAGSQDLEIFFRECGLTLTPVFDTQIAATLTGYPQQIGYGPLVQEITGVKLDKGDSYTDWSRRPLSDTQVEYALNDVRYLPEIYRELKSRLEQAGRVEWLQADFDRMADPATYEIIPEEQWRRVKRISSLNRRHLAVAREVAAWREREAIRRDIPKRWVIGDEGIVEVARRAPSTPEQLMDIRGVPEKIGQSAIRSLLEAVAKGVAVPESELPSLKKRRRPAGDIDGAVDLMVALVRLRAHQHGVAMPLLASRDDLERLASGERDGSPLLESWRKAMVGNELVELLDGEVTLSLEDARLQVVRNPRSAC
jgi:ribonuclease D